MLYNCGCNRTIEIDTTFFFFLSVQELERRCHEPNNGSETGNPWQNSYLETGDRLLPEDEEDYEDEREPEDPYPDIDLTMIGYEE